MNESVEEIGLKHFSIAASKRKQKSDLQNQKQEAMRMRRYMRISFAKTLDSVWRAWATLAMIRSLDKKIRKCNRELKKEQDAEVEEELEEVHQTDDAAEVWRLAKLRARRGVGKKLRG